MDNRTAAYYKIRRLIHDATHKWEFIYICSDATDNSWLNSAVSTLLFKEDSRILFKKHLLVCEDHTDIVENMKVGKPLAGTLDATWEMRTLFVVEFDLDALIVELEMVVVVVVESQIDAEALAEMPVAFAVEPMAAAVEMPVAFAVESMATMVEIPVASGMTVEASVGMPVALPANYYNNNQHSIVNHQR